MGLSFVKCNACVLRVDLICVGSGRSGLAQTASDDSVHVRVRTVTYEEAEITADNDKKHSMPPKFNSQEHIQFSSALAFALWGVR